MANLACITGRDHLRIARKLIVAGLTRRRLLAWQSQSGKAAPANFFVIFLRFFSS